MDAVQTAIEHLKLRAPDERSFLGSLKAYLSKRQELEGDVTDVDLHSTLDGMRGDLRMSLGLHYERQKLDEVDRNDLSLLNDLVMEFEALPAEQRQMVLGLLLTGSPPPAAQFCEPISVDQAS